VINAITDDDNLIDDLLVEPTITNVYRGHHPTYYGAPEIPHDGFWAVASWNTTGCSPRYTRVARAAALPKGDDQT
jgi:hypothetical protein